MVKLSNWIVRRSACVRWVSGIHIWSAFHTKFKLSHFLCVTPVKNPEWTTCLLIVMSKRTALSARRNSLVPITQTSGSAWPLLQNVVMRNTNSWRYIDILYVVFYMFLEYVAENENGFWHLLRKRTLNSILLNKFLFFLIHGKEGVILYDLTPHRYAKNLQHFT